MDYVFESPLEPDILLGPAFSQQAAPGGAPAHAGGAQGRRRLLSQGRRTRDPATRLLFDETRAWLKSTDRRAVFSFESICDCLDIDVDYLRRVCVNGGRPAGATAASARLREGEAGACSHVRARVRRATARQRARRARGKCFGSKTSLDRISDRETLRPAPARDGLRVLLVDHDADARDAIAAVVAECGAKVVAVGCGADALDALSELLRGSAGRCPPREAAAGEPPSPQKSSAPCGIDGVAAGFSSFGFSATIASMVSSSPATDAAF